MISKKQKPKKPVNDTRKFMWKKFFEGRMRFFKKAFKVWETMKAFWRFLLKICFRCFFSAQPFF